jgi:hypothetical protein
MLPLPMNDRSEDVKLLETLLNPSNDPELSEYERNMFVSMLNRLQTGEYQRLSRKQRTMATEVHERLKPIEASKVARGKAVELPEVLRPENLPKSPPGGRAYVPRQ